MNQPEPVLVVPAPQRTRRRAVLPLLAALLVGAAGAIWLALPASHESTDDAYLRADDTSVAPQVKGRVLDVLVRDHQRVKTGEALVRLDADDLAAHAARRPRNCRVRGPMCCWRQRRWTAWTPKSSWRRQLL